MRTMLAITLLLGLGWAQSLPTPQAVLNRLSQKAKTTRAYAYQWDYFKRDPNTGKLGAKQVYKLEFLKPHYRKLTIIQRDLFSNGAVLTYNPDQDSKVHARKGIIHRTYAPDDPEVADFFRTDLEWIANDLQRLFKGAKAEPVQRVKYNNRDCFRVAFAPKDATYTRVVLWLEVNDSMPIRIEYHDAKGLYSVREYTDYSFPNLKVDDFWI
ncbi:MAG: outer membrane lipoprotein-sorting protein [Fimbriimonadales bacterium]|nr:outer membrane lipoprotein-sorting protein [Fimbriimonadales bacterium]GBC89857.1 hypothetical protein HRbin14_00586 [bacterium HR14]